MAAIIPKVGVGALLSMMEAMQFLSMFSIINIAYTPGILKAYYSSLSLAMLEFLPNIFVYVIPPSWSRAYEPENELNEGFQNHPSIFLCLFFHNTTEPNLIGLMGKNFLYNIGNVFSIYALFLLFYIFLYFIAKCCSWAKRWKTQYEYTGVYCALLSSFSEVFLSACIQIKYVPFFPFVFSNRNQKNQ